MENDFSDTPRTVTITAVKDEAAKRAIAENLSRITSGHPPVERVLARLENLPWRLTRNARVSSAKKLVSILEGLGASVQISPPLPVDSVSGSQPPTEVSRAPLAAPIPSENQQTQSSVAAAPQAFTMTLITNVDGRHLPRARSAVMLEPEDLTPPRGQ